MARPFSWRGNLGQRSEARLRRQPFLNRAHFFPISLQGPPDTSPNAKGQASPDKQADAAAASNEDPSATTTTTERAADGEPLTEAEQDQVEQLRARDREVRAHEMAHKAAAGGYARGGPTYSYQQGPDGKRYAVGGSVNIDVSPVPGDPQATIQKMAVVRRAALAPAEPSSQDRKVAAQASQTAATARQELAQQRAEDLSGSNDVEPRDGDVVTRAGESDSSESTPRSTEPGNGDTVERDASASASNVTRLGEAFAPQTTIGQRLDIAA